jgi:hypothetical protein
MTTWTVHGAGKQTPHRELSLAIAHLAALHNAHVPARITTDRITWWQLHHHNDTWSFTLHHATPNLFAAHNDDEPGWIERALDIHQTITNKPNQQKDQP